VLMLLLLMGPLSRFISFVTGLIVKGMFAITGMSGFLI
jgi:hypothetical protein